MANRERKVVTIPVHKDWFEKVYEPQRKRLAEQIGKGNLSHCNFTEFMAKSNVGFAPIKMSKEFAPRKLRTKRGSFEFRINL